LKLVHMGGNHQWSSMKLHS